MLNRTSPDLVKLAVKEAGGTAALARALKIRSQAVSQWTRIPAAQVLQVEKLSGIPRHVLRSDLYPKPVEAAE